MFTFASSFFGELLKVDVPTRLEDYISADWLST